MRHFDDSPSGVLRLTVNSPKLAHMFHLFIELDLCHLMSLTMHHIGDSPLVYGRLCLLPNLPIC